MTHSSGVDNLERARDGNLDFTLFVCCHLGLWGGGVPSVSIQKSMYVL